MSETRDLSALAEKVEGLSRKRFIRQYLGKDAEGKGLTITGRGYTYGGTVGRRALRCACGADICEGWAFIPDDPDSLDWHMRRDHPMAETYEAFAAFLRAKGEQND